MEMSFNVCDPKKVYRATFKAQQQWRNILMELQVSSDDIEDIEQKYSGNPTLCYWEGLKEWLKGGVRSWGDLVKALSSPTVGGNDIAKEIERDYIQFADSSGVTSEKLISKSHSQVSGSLLYISSSHHSTLN